jgi:hypothetical protein
MDSETNVLESIFYYFGGRLTRLTMCINSSYRILWLLSMMLLCAACNPEKKTGFSELSPSRTGIDFANTLSESADFNVLKYGYFYNGGGVACADFNNDGWLDLYFTGNLASNKLYQNKGTDGFSFEDVTQKSGTAAADGWNTGVSIADVNADGLPDIYVCRSAAQNARLRRNLLFINHPDGVFTEEAEKYGLDDPSFSSQAVFFDFDLDGDLDCFILNHSVQDFAGFGSALPQMKKTRNPDYASKLMRNDKGKFVDVTDSSGLISNVLSFGLGVAVSDFNLDGYPDLYISNDYNEEDYLYLNLGNGKFTEQLRACFDHVSLFSMGSDAADLNNDGWTDLVTLDMMPRSNERIKMTSGDDNYQKYIALVNNGFYYQSMRNMLHLNTGNFKNTSDGVAAPLFSEIGQMAGISNTDWSWAAICQDFDLDMRKDLFITNGYARDYTNMEFLNYTMDVQTKAKQGGKVNQMEVIANMPAIQISNYLFIQSNPLEFADHTAQWGLQRPGMSNGAIAADFDRDGDLDLVVNNVNAPASVYRNETRQNGANNYLQVDLTRIPGPLALGAKVYVVSGGIRQMQEFWPSRGFQSCMYAPLVFGLAKSEIVDTLMVVWNNKSFSIQTNIPANTLVNPVPANASPRTIFPAGKSNFHPDWQLERFPFLHNEDMQNDFTVQPLLPFMPSFQGPRIAVDETGEIPIAYFCGAAGQAGQLFALYPGGAKATLQPDIAEDLNFEDADAIFADVDGDKDPDLIVVSAGYHLPGHSPFLAARLYINENGIFRRRRNAFAEEIPTSSSVVKTLDVDGDGDIDIFIGAACRPGNFPIAGNSSLWINDGKGFFNSVTPSLNWGLVTDAMVGDWNGDGNADLALSRLFGTVAIAFFQNGTFQLEDISETGMWIHLNCGEFGKGDTPEIIAGNWGLNHQLAAVTDNGLGLYYATFFGAGKVIPVLSYFQDGKEYPFAARDELVAAMPALKKKYTNYTSFSRATVQEIFGAESARSLALSARELRSVRIQYSKGKARVIPLPAEAQVSPLFASCIRDFNGDGLADLVLGGNLTHTRVRIGKMDANHGQVWINDGTGSFYLQHYLGLRGDNRSLAWVNTYNWLLAGINGQEAKYFRLMEK